MKTIKVKVLIMKSDGTPYKIEELFCNLNLNNFQFEYSNEPDYLIYQQVGKSDYFDYNCIRITREHENVIPDFNVCDYAISNANIFFEDRYCTLPDIAYPEHREYMEALANRKLFTSEDVKIKKRFCNFIYSNGLAEGRREQLFNLLPSYKKVYAGGDYLNNIGYKIPISNGDYSEKIHFQSTCKFSLAVENCKGSGYVTEKIVHAFVAGTIPIYWGTKDVDTFFNRNAYINCDDFESDDELLRYIIKVDNDENLYLSYLNAPKFVEGFDVKKYDKKIEIFLSGIFSQDVADAKRRGTVMHARRHQKDFEIGKKIGERRGIIKLFVVKIFKKTGSNGIDFFVKIRNLLIKN